MEFLNFSISKYCSINAQVAIVPAQDTFAELSTYNFGIRDDHEKKTCHMRFSKESNVFSRVCLFRGTGIYPMMH